MSYDFDTFIDRKPSNSLKWSYLAEHCGCEAEDILPLWIADADFASPPEVTEALIERAKHPIYGYAGKSHDYYDAFIHWTKKRHSFELTKDCIVYTPGIVSAIAIAIRAFTKEGDGIIIQSPVYYPFERTILSNKRTVINSPLINKNGSWTIDFEALELSAQKAKVLLFCSPHNPVGRVWTCEELQKVAKIAEKYKLLIISDEIHADLTMQGFTHTPFAKVSPYAENNSLICMAPSKTFNIAGLATSNIIIKNPTYCKIFTQEAEALGLKCPTIFGSCALIAAYNHGEDWLSEMLSYVSDNYTTLRKELTHAFPELVISPLEGTFLAWIDFSFLNKSDAEIHDLFIQKGRVWMDEGAKFGPGGSKHMRLNLACTRTTLEEGIRRIIKALS